MKTRGLVLFFALLPPILYYFAITYNRHRADPLLKGGKNAMDAPKEGSAEVSLLSVDTQRSTGTPYLIYKPPKFEENSLWPLLLFLHGAGESGNNPMEVLSEGATGCPLVELKEGRANDVLKNSFVIVAPQTNSGWNANLIREFVNGIVEDTSFRVDSTRMYATGVSMGGYGTWVAGTLGMFAAIAPICGAGSVPPSSLSDTPVWAFHGSNDVVVPVMATDEMVGELRSFRFGKQDESGGFGAANEVKYTRYETSPSPTGWERYEGHASWKQAYNRAELFDWLLKHKLNNKAP